MQLFLFYKYDFCGYDSAINANIFQEFDYLIATLSS